MIQKATNNLHKTKSAKNNILSDTVEEKLLKMKNLKKYMIFIG